MKMATKTLESMRRRRNRSLNALLNDDRYKMSMECLQSLLESQLQRQRDILNELGYTLHQQDQGNQKLTLIHQQKWLIEKISAFGTQLKSFTNTISPSSTFLADKKQLRSSLPCPKGQGLRAGYINIQGLAKKVTQVHYILERNGLDVLFVGETRLTPACPADSRRDTLTVYNYRCQTPRDSLIHIPGYTMVREDRRLGIPGQGGGLLAYIREGVSYEVVETYTAESQNPLQYIYLHEKATNSHLIGTFLAQYDKSQLLELFRRFEHEPNVVIMGDMNMDYMSKTYPYDLIEFSSGFNQLIQNYTCVTSHQAADDQGMSLTESLTDLIFTNDRGMITESGVIRCGVSDHALIFCTVSHNGDDFHRPDNILRHDMSLIISRMICGHIINHQLIIREPKFWLIASNMEIHQKRVRDMVEKGDLNDLHESAFSNSVQQKTDNKVAAYQHCKRCYYMHTLDDIFIGQEDDGSCLCGEMWKLYETINKTKTGNTVFLNPHTMEYLCLCFVKLEEIIHVCQGREILIVNPKALWNSPSHNIEDYLVNVENISLKRNRYAVAIKYNLQQKWHIYSQDDKFWSETRFDTKDGGLCDASGWTKFLNTFLKDSENSKSAPIGMTSFNHIICHRHLRFCMKDLLSQCEGDVIFAGESEGICYFFISPSKLDYHEYIASVISALRDQQNDLESSLYMKVLGDRNNPMYETIRSLMHTGGTETGWSN